MLRRLLPLAVLIAPVVIAGVLIPRVPAAACSCVEMTEAESFDLAHVVFTGELVEVRSLPPAELVSSGDPERFIFAVERVYKGTAFGRQSVVTPMDGASCGLEISGSGPFIVFADRNADNPVPEGVDGELYANLCGGTRDLDAAGVPAAFGDGVPPQAGSSPIGGPTASTDPSTTVATPATGSVVASEPGSGAIGVAAPVVSALVGATALGLLAILAMKRRRS